MKILERGLTLGIGEWPRWCFTVMTFLPVDLARAPAKEQPAVQLFMEPPKEPSVAEAQPFEPEVQEPEEPCSRNDARRKRSPK